MVLDVVFDFLDTQVMDTGITYGSVIFAAVFMFVGFIMARVIRTVFNKQFAPKMPEHTAKSMAKFLYFGIILVTFLVVVTSQGIDLSGLLVAGGIFGVVIGFATQSVVSNLISGIFLMIEKPAKIGDQVEIADMGIMGFITEISMFSTKIRKYDSTVVRIPNDKVFTSNLRLLYASASRRVDVVIGIAYKDDIQKAISVIGDALRKNMPYVLRVPAPEFYVEDLADSSVNIRVLVRHPPGHWDDVYPQLRAVIKQAFDDANIEIPFPQRVVTQS